MSNNVIILKLETQSIIEKHLIDKVDNIYKALNTMKRKCIKNYPPQALIFKEAERNSKKVKLKNLTWQSLTALCQTLFNKHHDINLTSQHSFTETSLHQLIKKHNLSSQLWHHEIYSYLELLRCELSDSWEHMLIFIYMIYFRMTLLVKIISAFKNIWVEHLKNLTRMTVEIQKSKIWTEIVWYWYNQETDRNSKAERIQHYLAVLIKSNVLLQLFFYIKFLICIQSSLNASESILQLFQSTSCQFKSVNHCLSIVLFFFTNAHHTLFMHDSHVFFINSMREFIFWLDNQIDTVTWRDQEIYITFINFATIFEYENPVNFMMKLFKQAEDQTSWLQILKHAQHYWHSSLHVWSFQLSDKLFETLSFTSHLTFHTMSLIIQHVDDIDVLSFIHVSLTFVWILTLISESMTYVETEMSWEEIAHFLNMLTRQDMSDLIITNDKFSEPETILLENFLAWEQIWSEQYYSIKFFNNSFVDESYVKHSHITDLRTNWCLWLSEHIAMISLFINLITLLFWSHVLIQITAVWSLTQVWCREENLHSDWIEKKWQKLRRKNVMIFSRSWDNECLIRILTADTDRLDCLWRKLNNSILAEFCIWKCMSHISFHWHCEWHLSYASRELVILQQFYYKWF